MSAPIELKLAAFEGPLDLLLHLIEKAQVDIQDVFVSEITAQYLQYMEQAQDLDMDRMSEFLAMAATLVYIKSRALLPRPAPIAEDEEEDPEEKLIRQLREYRQYKQISRVLEEMAEQAAHIHTRLPEEFPLSPPQIEWAETDIKQLYQTLLNVMARKKPLVVEQTLQNVRADAYTLEDRVQHIKRRMKKGERIAFSSIFDTHERMERIVTFMALLEMLALGEIQIQQEYPFGEIMMMRKEASA